MLYELEDYKNDNTRNIFIQFSNIETGKYLQTISKQYTPYGVYCYPLKEYWNEMLKKKDLINSNYTIVFSCSHPMLVECSEYTNNMLMYDTNKKAIFKHPFIKYWDQILSECKLGKNKKKINMLMNVKFRNKGYVGFTDKFGKGFIDKNRKYLSVILDNSHIKYIDTISNKYELQ